jgi:hypothetical protein
MESSHLYKKMIRIHIDNKHSIESHDAWRERGPQGYTLDHVLDKYNYEFYIGDMHSKGRYLGEIFCGRCGSDRSSKLYRSCSNICSHLVEDSLYSYICLGARHA